MTDARFHRSLAVVLCFNCGVPSVAFLPILDLRFRTRTYPLQLCQNQVKIVCPFSSNFPVYEV